MVAFKLIPIFSIALVAACSTSSDETTVSDTSLLTEDAGTVAEALAAGKTLTSGSRLSSAIVANHAANSAQAAEPPVFTITRNDAGAVDVTIGDLTTSYTPEDLKEQRGWLKDDGTHTIEVYSWSTIDGAAGAEEALVGTKTFADYHQVWGYIWKDNADTQTSRGFAVVGTYTNEAVLEVKANAIYTGYATAELQEMANPGNARSRLYGGVLLQADFETAVVSGEIHSLQQESFDGVSWGERQAWDSRITVEMVESPIEGNGFDGGLMMREPGLDPSSSGTYSGRFFGVAGEEVGGVLAIEYDDQVGAGFFSTKQQ